MPSNAQARARASFFQVPNARPTDDMPEWLRSQFTMTGAGGGGDAGDGQEQWLSPGHIVRDSQGRRVVMLGDNRQLEGTNDLAMNEDYNPETDSYFDPDLGWVADGSKVNDQPWQKTKGRNRAIAATVLSAMAGGAALSAAGAGAGAAGEAGGVYGGMTGTEGGMFAGWAPEVAAEAGAGAGTGWEGLGAGDGMSVPDAGGMPFEQSPIPSLEDLGVNPNTGGGTFEGTGWTPEGPPSGMPNWLNPQNAGRLFNAARSLFGGGANPGGRGAGGPGGSIMGGFGAAPRIGDHKADTDPYGLAASGWRGGMTAPDAKQKVAEAMMEKMPWKYDQVDPWRFWE